MNMFSKATNARGVFHTWIDFGRPVGRETYLVSGVVLLGIKYAFDATVLWLTTRALWSPVAYLDPRPLARFPAGTLGTWGFWLVASTTLIFIAIGVSLTIRRCADAGLSPWLGLLFVLPFLNYALFAILVVLGTPARGATPDTPGDPPEGSDPPRWQHRLAAAGIGATLGLVGAATSIFAWSRYGVVLFVATPFFAGFLTSWALNHRQKRPLLEMLWTVGFTVLAGCAGLLAFGLEGLICIVMALPLLAGLALLGGALARELAGITHGGRRARHVHLTLFLVLPLLPAMEGPTPAEPLRSVTTELVLDAPPADVWPHVVSFPELPPPRRLLFRLGIAAPVGARIAGAGVGSVRHCEFTTGSFVEPITVWDEPRRLAFDVASQPPPMRELSPYARVLAPHLDTGFEVLRGEFRLLPEGDGTRLVGTTWYRVHLAPELYWRLWSDSIVHAIHDRVLEHIARLATEGSEQRADRSRSAVPPGAP
jgi:uncharacterized membrane protein YhaH (DUF805 family)